MDTATARRPAENESERLAWEARARSMERFRFTVTRPVAVLMVLILVVIRQLEML